MKLRLGAGAYQPTALVIGFEHLTWWQRALKLSQAADDREHDVEVDPPAEGLGHALGHAVERAHSLHIRAECDAPIVHVRCEHYQWDERHRLEEAGAPRLEIEEMREQRVVDTAQRTEEPMADGQLAVPLNLILGVHKLFAESVISEEFEVLYQNLIDIIDELNEFYRNCKETLESLFLRESYGKF